MTFPNRTHRSIALGVLLATALVLGASGTVSAQGGTPTLPEPVPPAIEHPTTDRVAGDSLLAVSVRGSCDDTPPAGSGDLIKGIDISHWNGAISWGKVKGDGIKFVFAKATQRVDFEDDKYWDYRKGAKEQNIRFGAYEYMDVEGGVDRAVKDAQHFVKFADPGPNNLVPVLDAEQTNGYSPDRLKKWMTAWLEEVHRKLGVKPIIYASPSFWETALDDTKFFAKEGYPLWIAHWGVDDPRLPAENWNGEGWDFWQWTSCGTVEGISGRVDLDLYKRDRLKPFVIENART